MAKKNAYSLKEISLMYGRPYTTTRRHIGELILEKKFKKKSRGTDYNREEVKQLSKLLIFNFKD